MDSYKNPPKWALSILQRICPPDLIEEVEGDLFEAFQWRVNEKGLSYARRKYIFEVFKSFRHFKLKVQTQNNSIMLFQNYFKTGLRFLWKTKGYSSLNILGLALGIAISWMAYIFVSDEYSFDSFYSKADHIYRVKSVMTNGDNQDLFAGSSYIMGEEYPKQIPEIVLSSRYKNTFFLTRSGNEYLNLTAHYADKDFFEMFDVELIIGDIGDFTEPNQIVISKSTADRYQIPLDLSQNEMTLIRRGEEHRYVVSAIYEDFPTNTSIHPRALIPFSQWANANQRRTSIWFDINMNSFFTLSEDIDPALVSEKMTEVLLKNDSFNEDTKIQMGLQPLKDIHLNPDLGTGNGISARGDNEMITITIIIGIFCLLIACLNYANFAVGNYLIRLKEMALRRVFGTERGGIFKQFITEAFISAFLALVLSIGLIYIILPTFANYANKTYDLSVIFSQKVLIGGVLILIIATFLAGIYPALLLSRFKTIAALKGKSQINGKTWISKGLITLQFSIAVFLIASMLTMDKQLSYMLEYDLGYDSKNVIQVFRSLTDDQTRNTFKNRLTSITGIESISISSGFNGTNYKQDDGERVRVRHARVDENYISTLGIELIAGRDFDPDIALDFTKAIIVNEAFVKERQLKNPIGTQINFGYGDFQKPTIIGVVKDFNFESLHRSVEPLIIYMGEGYTETYYTSIKVSSMSQELLAQIEEVHNELFSPYQLNYSLMEDDLADQYYLEANIQNISRAGALVAILLSCIGLMGFVGTQIRQKLKEVSIRKVIGANSNIIFSLYTRKYFLLLTIGIVIGLTAAYSIMQGWLENYTYSIKMNWQIGFVALLGVLAVATLTIFSQLYKAITANPVKYLKDD